MIFSSLPIRLVDMFGSVAMVVIAVLALDKAKQLRELDHDNTIFLYLLWISTGFTIFAVSRSFSHILKQFLVLTANPDIWASISPYTGAVNTVSFMLVGLITLFFNQNWKINEKILTSREKLEEAHDQLMSLNQTLEHKVVERTEMLTSSEHKARRIFEQSLDTIVVTDARFRISEINQAGITLTGYQKADMLDREMGFGDFITKPSDWARLRDLLTTSEFVLNEETDFLRPDGSQIRVLITGGADYGAFGCGKTFHFIIKDINEKKQMEQQIAQADKLAALGELSAGVAHEINNPLGIILGYTQLMLKEEAVKADTGFEEDLKTIEKHVKNCKDVVSDLLSFSRKGSKERGRVDVHRVVDGVVKFLSNHTDFRRAEVRLGLWKGDTLNVNGNAQELTQVMINLMINACHAVEGIPDGCIEVITDKEGADVLISVQDNGTGIKKRHLPRIFDPFFTTKPVGQGTGLGLSVGYGIIRRHGGTITAGNREEGGAVFTIRLPLEQDKGGES
ncbi:MAG: PAS domain S-box protein [Desulfobacter sp.]|nr:MAG: PAS domain S-box protein [Desulfobacter sp.]